MLYNPTESRDRQTSVQTDRLDLALAHLLLESTEFFAHLLVFLLQERKTVLTSSVPLHLILNPARNYHLITG